MKKQERDVVKTGKPLLEAGGGGGGQYRLPKAAPQYEIWSRRQNKMVGTTSSREGATRAVDRRDIDYGAADHFWKKIGQ